MPKQQQNINAFFGNKGAAAKAVPGVEGPETALVPPVEVVPADGPPADGPPNGLDVKESARLAAQAVTHMQQSHVATSTSAPIYAIFDKNAPPVKHAEQGTKAKKRKADDKSPKPSRKSARGNGSAQNGRKQVIELGEEGDLRTPSGSAQSKDLVRPALNLLRVPGTSSRTMSRTTSSSSFKGSAYSEPIVIEDDEVPGTREEPIRIDDTPVVTKRPALSAHPFFAARAGVESLPSMPRANGVTKMKLVATAAPWPTADNQHVRSNLHIPSGFGANADRRPFKRRRLTRKSKDAPVQFDYRRSLAPSLLEPESSFPPLPQAHPGVPQVEIPEAHLRCPAISRLSSVPTRPLRDGEMWCDKYRPSRAAEVLGNEAPAQYLKSWLQALELHVVEGTKDTDGSNISVSNTKGEMKRQIIRAVDKTRRRKKRKRTDDYGSDDWIVSDDETGGFELPEDPVEDWDALDNGALSDNGSTASSAGPPPFLITPRPSRHLAAHDFSQRLTNAILISGPPGCGKTAAVYACVQELGWDVFEVYPGIGRRSGAGLMSLVGEVGRNHLVRKGPPAGNGVFHKLLFGGNKPAKEDSTFGTRDQPISVDTSSPPDSGFGFIESVASNGTNGINAKSEATILDAPKVRQSIILLEEVDILFREDAGFWQAVVGLVKESHRPVIMTCNDPTLVPIEDLPLQEHLMLEAPGKELLISYLQRIASIEGRIISSQIIDGIREDNGDLRKAINAMQWACSGQLGLNAHLERPSTSSTFQEDGTEAGLALVTKLKKHDAFLDCWSFVDAYLNRPASRAVQVLEIDRYMPSADDEQGHVTLLKPHPADTDIGIAAALHDQQFMDEVYATALSHFSDFIPPLEGDPAAAGAYDSGLLTYLAPLIPISSYLLPHPAVVVDYAPYVRAIVRADDEAAEADDAREAARFSRAGRPVRLAAAKQNARLPYVRSVALNDLALVEARRGTLSF